MRSAPFEIRNQVVFSARLSEDPKSPCVDIEQKRESFVAVLGKEDGPGLRKQFATHAEAIGQLPLYSSVVSGRSGENSSFETMGI